VTYSLVLLDSGEGGIQGRKILKGVSGLDFGEGSCGYKILSTGEEKER